MKIEQKNSTELTEVGQQTTSADHREDQKQESPPPASTERRWYATATCWLVASTVFLATLALFLGLYVGTSVFDSNDDDTTVRAPPPPPVVIPVVPSVRSEISFDTLEIEAFQSPEFDAAFRTNFTTAMSRSAGVGVNQVSILSIAAGSTKVVSTVTFSQAEQALADSFRALLESNVSAIFLADEETAAVWQAFGVNEAPVVVTTGTCPIRNLAHIGDGWCDSGAANTPECGWDGGDCCNVDVPLYDCLDPLSPSFGRSAPRGAVYPAPTNPRYSVPERPISTEDFVSTYNNFYEFGFSKSDPHRNTRAQHVQDFFAGPWTVTIDGLVENPLTLDVRDLVNNFHLEERIYRHRCVEAWSIVVPWVGFPLYKLLDLVRPLAGAKYVSFQTFLNASIAPAQGGRSFNWPYLEGLSIEEARNEMAFISVGQYQAPLPPQSGAPIRLTVPWKYGFKSAKSVVRISFVEEQPYNFWQEANAREYGFWANVNPRVDHPRWSQAEEREFISQSYGDIRRIPTQYYNGYEDLVGYLYEGMEDELGDLLYR
mmetsp:Transcript_9193/g.19015  ORF Transcript_9193/g.19015 Transcript_9193/m.19015 type:complete len:542 (-) Transcript_9193:134-1759(-)|eukprot:CAMPEP_0118935842 /NCGR_PEP_ID=MMETSP1169-20130426/15859_1 /TAXON_ID=36882 /ORGANISM="Pyramimonas obovata, Strain CCMP722" /LENGTH=541 /DNA_ID=CAMNT_0006878909 /DNA_START=74 /DNA_END=1699 /DNA_ORIENTATION=-